MTATPLPHPATVASVRASLCVQSAMLSGMITRLQPPATHLRPPVADGWAGRAEYAHTLLVLEIARTAGAALDALERARTHTATAIWDMPNG